MKARTAPVIVAALTVGLAATQTPPPELVGAGTISKPDRYESFGSLSPDGREFYFTIHQPNFGQHHIVVSRFVNGQWSAPSATPFSSAWNDREPKLSPDGRRLYFSSNRPAEGTQPTSRLDLFMVGRDAAGTWGTPQRLAPPVNTEVHEFCPVAIADGTLYFISPRAGGIRGPEPTDLYNVWRARALDKSGLRFAEPENLGKAINSGFETNVYVSPDERTMLVSRDGAPDSLGGDDLYVSTRVNGTWQTLRHLPAPINSDKYEYGPSISADGRSLFFTSARAGTADIYRIPVSVLGTK